MPSSFFGLNYFLISFGFPLYNRVTKLQIMRLFISLLKIKTAVFSETEVQMKRFILCILFIFLIIVSTITSYAAETLYYIGPGDVLEISVWKDPELSRTIVVPPDGVVAFPLIETINTTNLTITDLKKIVKKKLSEYVPDVTVTVMLMEINSLKAYVIGKVNNPGEFPIQLESTVMQILSMAGGLTPFASDGNIMIIRQQKRGIEQIPFDYGQVEKGKRLEQNIFLKKGDVVVVP